MASVVESTERALSEVEQGSAQGLLDNRNVGPGGPAVAQPTARTPARSGPGDSLAELLAAASGPRAGPVSLTVARLSGGRL